MWAVPAPRAPRSIPAARARARVSGPSRRGDAVCSCPPQPSRRAAATAARQPPLRRGVAPPRETPTCAAAEPRATRALASAPWWRVGRSDEAGHTERSRVGASDAAYDKVLAANVFARKPEARAWRRQRRSARPFKAGRPHRLTLGAWAHEERSDERPYRFERAAKEPLAEGRSACERRCHRLGLRGCRVAGRSRERVQGRRAATRTPDEQCGVRGWSEDRALAASAALAPALCLGSRLGSSLGLGGGLRHHGGSRPLVHWPWQEEVRISGSLQHLKQGSTTKIARRELIRCERHCHGRSEALQWSSQPVWRGDGPVGSLKEQHVHIRPVRVRGEIPALAQQPLLPLGHASHDVGQRWPPPWPQRRAQRVERRRGVLEEATRRACEVARRMPCGRRRELGSLARAWIRPL